MRQVKSIDDNRIRCLVGTVIMTLCLAGCGDGTGVAMPSYAATEPPAATQTGYGASPPVSSGQPTEPPAASGLGEYSFEVQTSLGYTYELSFQVSSFDVEIDDLNAPPGSTDIILSIGGTASLTNTTSGRNIPASEIESVILLALYPSSAPFCGKVLSSLSLEPQGDEMSSEDFCGLQLAIRPVGGAVPEVDVNADETIDRALILAGQGLDVDRQKIIDFQKSSIRVDKEEGSALQEALLSSKPTEWVATSIDQTGRCMFGAGKNGKLSAIWASSASPFDLTTCSVTGG